MVLILFFFLISFRCGLTIVRAKSCLLSIPLFVYASRYFFSSIHVRICWCIEGFHIAAFMISWFLY
jgi:hypothetical protein